MFIKNFVKNGGIISKYFTLGLRLSGKLFKSKRIGGQSVFNLNRIPLYHTLSTALEMSRKTPITSIVGSQSKDEFISWTIDNNCKICES